MPKSAFRCKKSYANADFGICIGLLYHKSVKVASTYIKLVLFSIALFAAPRAREQFLAHSFTAQKSFLGLLDALAILGEDLFDDLVVHLGKALNSTLLDLLVTLYYTATMFAILLRNA